MEQQPINKLIILSKNEDLQAFRKLIEAHQSYVYRVSFRLLCNEDDAQDATQETFIRVWKHLKHFKSEMRFSTWLYKIATNICYDRIKAAKRRNLHVSFHIENARLLNMPSGENVESALINEELAIIIGHFTSLLTPKQKLVFTLHDLEGLEVSEIVIITGLSPGKIKSNLYCARQYIREKLLIFNENQTL
jgi:RNA polymerase sigma-70 factor, ECF subfamily